MMKYINFIIIFLLSIVIFSVLHYAFHFSTISVLTGLTFTAILWYSYETLLLRQETQNQTELQITPYVVLSWPNPDNNTIIAVKNVGNGVALNIKPIKILSHNDKDIKIYSKPLFIKTLLLGQEDRLQYFRLLSISDSKKGVGASGSSFDIDENNCPITILFQYEDIAGSKYKAIYNLFNKDIEIVKQGKQ